MSSIVTFYSYKGGVGRSMALANIAVILAQRGLKVLAVDWDLEAPGLERYFAYFDITPGGPGLLRMCMELRDGRAADYTRFTSSIDCDTRHPITLLASGREHDDGYSRNLEAFDWEEFFKHGGGEFVESLRQRWRDEFDIVLIDSRTGLSDTGGICTIQLPDVVVAMFTANYQSLHGVCHVMRLAQKARQRLAYDRMPLTVLPLPARWGVQEFRETQLWLGRVTEAVQDFYDDWLPRPFSARTVVEQVKVPQVDYFGFGEKLAVVEQGTSDPQGMGFIYEKVASLLASDFKDVSALVVNGAARETRGPASLASTVGSADRADYLFDVFVSHDRSTPAFVLDFVQDLKTELTAQLGREADFFVDIGEIRTGEVWDQEIGEALVHSRTLVVLLTSTYLNSPTYAREAVTFVQRAHETRATVLFPVVVRGDEPPVWLADFKWLDLRLSAIAKVSSSHLPGRPQREITRLASLLSDGIAKAPPYNRHWAAVLPEFKRDSKVSLLPVDLVLVTGDRLTHGDLGLTINMTCRLSNNGTKAIELNRLAIAMTKNGRRLHHLAWHLFYDRFGSEHVRTSGHGPITVGGESVWQQGVQFREQAAAKSSVWSAGHYEIELRGWVDRPSRASANLKTGFRVEVPAFVEREMKRWQTASQSEWSTVSDRAVGFPVLVTDIRAGL
jgi:MinD-like ATPase involved in chromosome partitioning or flagellar assembly